jgi:hypothetical protein
MINEYNDYGKHISNYHTNTDIGDISHGKYPIHVYIAYYGNIPHLIVRSLETSRKEGVFG